MVANNVAQRRLVGVIVLIAIGILIAVILTRCSRPGDSVQDGNTRVYNITPSGQVIPEGQRQPGTNGNTASAPGQGEMGLGPRGSQPARGQGPAGGVQPAQPGTQAQPAPSPRVTGQQSQPVPEPQTGTKRNTQSEVQAAPAPESKAKTRPKANTKPKPQSESESHAEASAQAATAPATQSGQWLVQVGSFAKEGNASQLKTQLAKRFPAYVEKAQVNGHTYYRVRVGPYDSKQQAKVASGALRSAGYDAQVQSD